jgi:hypothetical protein
MTLLTQLDIVLRGWVVDVDLKRAIQHATGIVRKRRHMIVQIEALNHAYMGIFRPEII